MFTKFSAFLFSFTAVYGISNLARAETEAIFVANNKAGSISVINAFDFNVLCEINVTPDLRQRQREWGLVHKLVNWYAEWRFADDIRISPDGNTFYVSRASLSDVAAFRVSNGEMLWRVPLEGYRTDHMNLTSDGERIFVSAIAANKVFVIDTSTAKVVGSFKTGSQPHTIEFSPDESLVYVGERKGKRLTVADTQTLRVLRHIDFEEGVRPFEITRDNSTLFVQLSNYHGFLEYDLVNAKLKRKIDLPQNEKSKSYGGQYPREAPHHGLSISRDDKTLCIAATAADYVALVSRPQMTLHAQVPVGEQPGFVIQSLNAEYCYATSRGSDTVSIVSYAKRAEVKRIRVGAYPQRLATARVSSVCGANH